MCAKLMIESHKMIKNFDEGSYTLRFETMECIIIFRIPAVCWEDVVSEGTNFQIKSVF